jgi:hypothetical protein
MDDYISREEFIEQKRKLYCENCSRRKDSKGKTVYEIGDAPCRACGIGDVLDDLDDFPAADVRPVVRGKWIDAVQSCHDSPHVICSMCGEYYWRYFNKFNFCPNCGADMREEN